MSTRPEVFIIESLSFDDEEKERFEGQILSSTLKLAGKQPKYYYFRTRRELEEILKIFRRSKYRYLHLSCHGDKNAIATTLETIRFQELGFILSPYLDNRRLFVSSCEVVNRKFADALMPESDCLSIIGPRVKVGFDEAAVAWSSFYYLAFTENFRAMKRRDIKPILRDLARLFALPIAYCSAAPTSRQGYELETLR